MTCDPPPAALDRKLTLGAEAEARGRRPMGASITLEVLRFHTMNSLRECEIVNTYFSQTLAMPRDTASEEKKWVDMPFTCGP